MADFLIDMKDSISHCVNNYLDSVNMDYSQYGKPPVSSQDVVGRCLGNLIGTLSVVAQSLDYLLLL